MRNLKVGAFTVAVIGVAAIMIGQQQQIKRLRLECADLHGQLGQAEALRNENQQWAVRFKASVDASQADRSELMRLRAQSSRLRQLEQENSQFKD